jgi:transglutaminase-like putative cysteine protease
MKKSGFVLLVFQVLFLAGCEKKAPVIFSLDPRIGMIGEVLTIRGVNFGIERNESYVTIAGTPPTSSSYITWQDDLIAVRIPEFGSSGLVYVYAGGKKSNPLLFSNRVAIPEPVQDPELGINPRISSVEPNSGSIGALITIQGSNFGSSREGSGVFFSWDAETSPSAPAEIRFPNSVEVFEADFGYELWSEREIQVRIPDGAISGNLEVRTPRGSSGPVFFDITGKPGTKTFKDKRSYTISYAVDIQVRDASVPNTLYLWVPQPLISASQRKALLLSRSTDPLVENYRKTTLFQLNNMPVRTGTGITLSYQVDVYTMETAIRVQSIKQDSGSPIAAAYTLPAPLIPSDDPGIKAKTIALVGRERNPYIKAQKIYEWLINSGEIRIELSSGLFSGGAVEALETKRADSYMAALLFCAMARAAGIPALPVSGILVDRFRSTSRHYWVEFWLDGFGWVPLDPALGAGAAPASFNLREDRGRYYFGNMDNQRIAFSRGQTSLSQMDPRGRVTARNRDYALQNLWEEAVGGLESYSSLWSDVTITGMYAQ